MPPKFSSSLRAKYSKPELVRKYRDMGFILGRNDEPNEHGESVLSCPLRPGIPATVRFESSGEETRQHTLPSFAESTLPPKQQHRCRSSSSTSVDAQTQTVALYPPAPPPCSLAVMGGALPTRQAEGTTTEGQGKARAKSTMGGSQGEDGDEDGLVTFTKPLKTDSFTNSDERKGKRTATKNSGAQETMDTCAKEEIDNVLYPTLRETLGSSKPRHAYVEDADDASDEGKASYM